LGTDARVTIATFSVTEDVISPMALSWQQHAACRGLSTDIFYPVSDDDADEAKSICAICPVREACLEFALAHREREGIWGGATERERRRLVRQRRKTA
jgi:WhiB family redox-sensing transcriptional regulator